MKYQYIKGINTFDTAENYGLSEVSLGNWMKERNNRKKVVVITKGCHPYDGVDRMTPEYLKQEVNAFPIVSASTAKRIEENVKAIDIELTDEEARWLNLEV